MLKDCTLRPIEVIVVASDGATYIIERRCMALGRDDRELAYSYCCLPDGQAVSWLGANLYQLPDGTTVHAVASRLKPIDGPCPPAPG